MEANTEQTRQLLGCGWLPLPAENLLRFRRVPRPAGYTGVTRKLDNGSVTDDPETCPGYTTALPEVIEVAREDRGLEDRGDDLQFATTVRALLHRRLSSESPARPRNQAAPNRPLLNTSKWPPGAALGRGKAST